MSNPQKKSLSAVENYSAEFPKHGHSIFGFFGYVGFVLALLFFTDVIFPHLKEGEPDLRWSMSWIGLISLILGSACLLRYYSIPISSTWKLGPYSTARLFWLRWIQLTLRWDIKQYPLTKKKIKDVMVSSLIVIPILAGLAIFGLQVFSYLRSGTWSPFSILDLTQLILQSDWIASPTTWLGLHEVVSGILGFIPAALGLIFGPWIIGSAVTSFREWTKGN